MKPAWDTLMDDFKDSTTAVIGDIDCTVHQDLCGKYVFIKFQAPW